MFSITWRLAIILAIGIGVFYGTILIGIFGKIPSNEDLKNIIHYQASEVYSSDNVLLGRYFVENRSESNLKDIAPCIINALIATEDSRFYEHEGIDHRSLVRVLIKTIILGKNTGGGSTISQQLAKNVFGRKDFGWLTIPVIKIRESIIANKLNQVYTKDEILELYLNTVSLGEDTYGIKTACERFFSTSPDKIKTEQAAVLIGMLKAPTSYNPRLHPEKSKRRRNTVLTQMQKYDFIDINEAEKLKGMPLVLNYSRVSNKDNLALHFRESLKIEIQKWLNKNPGEDGNNYNLLTDGLRIQTTIDSRMQLYAQEAVTEHLNALQPKFDADLTSQGKLPSNGQLIQSLLKKTAQYSRLKDKGLSDSKATRQSKSTIDSIRNALSLLQVGFLVTDPRNGQVLASVGGRDFKHSQYDHITSKRQVGSVFKPIVYAKALEDGYDPCDFVSNQRVEYTMYDNWSPKNSNKKYDGSYSLIGGLTNSVNTISVKLLMESGIHQVIEFAERLGAKDDLPAVPSIALGAANMSIREISSIYSVFSNDGIKVQSNFILSIKNNSGDELYNPHVEKTDLLDQEIAHEITNMMQSVANQGTAIRLRSWYHLTGEIAAKTGTTQNHADGWFVGFTPAWLGVVWVGADNPSLHFSTLTDGQGANMALPIWAKFYSKLSRDTQLKSLTQKAFPFNNYLTDCDLYKEDNIVEKIFKKDFKKNRKSGLDSSVVNAKKKNFWDLFKKKKKKKEKTLTDQKALLDKQCQ